uniref:Uncharacterized protein n=1 Tax=Arundo donax TaxID=35708 RepID=A0A0A9TY87_ARUDO
MFPSCLIIACIKLVNKRNSLVPMVFALNSRSSLIFGQILIVHHSNILLVPISPLIISMN